MDSVLPGTHGLTFRPKLHHVVSHVTLRLATYNINDVLQNGVTTGIHSTGCQEKEEGARPGWDLQGRGPLLFIGMLLLRQSLL